MKPIKIICLILFAVSMGYAQDKEEDQFILFTNVNVWDGTAEKLTKADVLVKNNIISEVKANIKAPNGAKVIDGKGGTLMPGLIDAHTHFMLNGTSGADIENNQTWEDIAIGGASMAEMYLMEGFTTVRDMGGANAGLRRAIDAGLIAGPRFYSAGALIGGRGGHGDLANFSSLPGDPTQAERLNI
ncbi:MAG: amidohydrolase family protein, partial [Flavobacteriaceae bacterium]